MPFQSGNQIRRGASNPNAGRKPNTLRKELEQLCADVMPEATRKQILSSVVKKAKDGDLDAAKWLFELRYGKARTATADADERLANARAMFLEYQLACGFLQAQTRELVSRAARTEVESEMWEKQFVTEEEQEMQLQALAAAVNKVLLQTTPEQFAALTDGKPPDEQLEALKGYLGRNQAEVVGEVLAGRGAATDADAEEE